MAGGDEDQWFDDYDEPMSDGEDEDAYPSDSGAGSSGGTGSSGSGGGDDGFDERGPSEALSEQRNRLYSVIDRQNLRRMQVSGAAEAAGQHIGGRLAARRPLAAVCAFRTALQAVPADFACAAFRAGLLLRGDRHSTQPPPAPCPGSAWLQPQRAHTSPVGFQAF